MLPNTSETFRKQMFAEEATLVWALAATGCSVLMQGQCGMKTKSTGFFISLISWILFAQLDLFASP